MSAHDNAPGATFEHLAIVHAIHAKPADVSEALLDIANLMKETLNEKPDEMTAMHRLLDLALVGLLYERGLTP